MSSLSTLPKGDSAWLLRKSIQRIMQQVSVLETNIGSSTTGNSSNTQVIFNDNGTLRGDAGLTYNAATDTLSAGSATITGDLTVDTSTLVVNSSQDRVAIGFSGNASSGRLQINQPLGSTIDGALRITDNATTSFVFNNVSSGVSGIWSSGAIAFGVGSGTFTEAMRLNSTGLGVGASPVVPLHIFSGGTGTTDFGNVVGTFRTGASGRAVALQFSDTSNFANIGMLSGALQFAAGGSTTHMTISTAGNVGIGVTPSAWLTAVKALDIGSQAMGIFSGGITHNAYYDNTDGRWEYKGNGAATYWNIQGGIHQWYVAASGIANNPITTFANAAMTLDASGNLFIGKTATGLGTVGIQASPSGWFQATVSGDASLFTNRLASDGKTVQLYRQTLEVGNISVTTTGATFNSTSDYRLKEAVAPLSGGLARVNALKPSVYKWKSNGLSGEGFLAHELADVVPAAVNGEKDAVNEDGSINAQSIDMSRVVPILVAAIQELTARVQTLETR